MMSGEVRPWHYAIAAVIIGVLVIGWVMRSQRAEAPRSGIAPGATPFSGAYDDAGGPPKAPAAR